jgi:hypothetical protein
MHGSYQGRQISGRKTVVGLRRVILLAGVSSLVMAFLGTVLASNLVTVPSVAAQQAAIRASAVSVVGDDGAERINLNTGSGSPDNASINFSFAGGTPSARLGVDRGVLGNEALRPKLVLNDDQGDEVLTLQISGTDGSPHMVLRDKQGKTRMHQFLDGDGTAHIQLLDSSGNVTWSAP